MTDKYAVIGNPIGHTKSPLIHMSFARQTGQDIEYVAIEGPLGGFRQAADAFRQHGGCGMNVTAPFKLDAFAYATHLSEQARLAGAVNALKFANGRIEAQNFDGIGLTRDIVHNLGTPMQGKRVLLLGAGGAARGAMLPFLKEKPAALLLVNRTVSKAKELFAQFSLTPGTASFPMARIPNLATCPGSSTWSSTPPRPACAANCRRCAPASSRPMAWLTSWPTARD